eukprot:29446-Pelagococcus_subviridis.AAC.4
MREPPPLGGDAVMRDAPSTEHGILSDGVLGVVDAVPSHPRARFVFGFLAPASERIQFAPVRLSIKRPSISDDDVLVVACLVDSGAVYDVSRPPLRYRPGVVEFEAAGVGSLIEILAAQPGQLARCGFASEDSEHPVVIPRNMVLIVVPRGEVDVSVRGDFEIGVRRRGYVFP